MDVLENIYRAFSDASAMEGTLKARLGVFQSELNEIVPPLEGAYESLVQRFRETIDDNQIPGVGQRMPDFLLPNENGGLTGLDELVEQGPCVISFNRGHWCFHCMLELHALAQAHEQIRQMNGQLVSIVPEKIVHTQAIRAICNLPFPVLSDLDHGLGAAMGLLISARNELHDLFVASGLDLASFQGNESWFLPIPAIFVVDKGGIIQSRFIDPDFRTRTEPLDIVAALRELS